MDSIKLQKPAPVWRLFVAFVVVLHSTAIESGVSIHTLTTAVFQRSNSELAPTITSRESLIQEDMINSCDRNLDTSQNDIFNFQTRFFPFLFESTNNCWRGRVLQTPDRRINFSSLHELLHTIPFHFLNYVKNHTMIITLAFATLRSQEDKITQLPQIEHFFYN